MQSNRAAERKHSDRFSNITRLGAMEHGLCQHQLYSLSDVTGILKGAPYEKRYLSGRLGGIPRIQRLDFELNYANHKVG